MGLQALAKDAHRAAVWAIDVVDFLKTATTAEALAAWHQTLTEDEREALAAVTPHPEEGDASDPLELLALSVREGNAFAVAVSLFRVRFTGELKDSQAALIVQAIYTNRKN